MQPGAREHLETLLAVFFSQRARSAEAHLVPNPFLNTDLKAFMHRAAPSGLRTGRGLRVFAPRAGDSILPTDRVLVTRDSDAEFAKSMDHGFTKFSPAKLLSHDLFKEVHARGICARVFE